MALGRVYIASTLSNADRVRALAATLRSAAARRGLAVTITYDWTNHGTTGPIYVPDDQPELKRDVAVRELLGILSADVVLVVMPGERGTHFEFGVAFALRKPIVLLLDGHDGRSPSFHFLDSLVRAHAETEAITATLDFIAGVRKLDDHPLARLLCESEMTNAERNHNQN